MILVGKSIYYIELKQAYTLQTVPQVGKIVHFEKCLEFAAFKAVKGGRTGGEGGVKTVFLKLNGFSGFRNKLY